VERVKLLMGELMLKIVGGGDFGKENRKDGEKKGL